jgi:hypothetical protein
LVGCKFEEELDDEDDDELGDDLEYDKRIIYIIYIFA